jgi:hypothetical protein
MFGAWSVLFGFMTMGRLVDIISFVITLGSEHGAMDRATEITHEQSIRYFALLLIWHFFL